jgi:predicted alpha-1,2-mannosidase
MQAGTIMRPVPFAIALAAFTVCVQGAPQPFTLKNVDVFLGSEGGGNTTPGAQVPFGFVVLQPDMTEPYTSGYRSGGLITGFSHTHESGTGGGSKYGNFRVAPLVGPLRPPQPLPGSEEIAWPGYYAITLGTGDARVHAELTASRLVGFHRYTFPRTRDAHLSVNVGAVIAPPALFRQHAIKCQAEAVGRLLRGSCTYRGGWNPGEYTLHFAARFDRRPSAIGVGPDFERASTQAGFDREGGALWAWASFDTRRNQHVGLKLAVSFISTAKAEANLRTVGSQSFDEARRDAERQWKSALARIAVEGGTEAQRTLLYSALYRVQVMPHDLSGENGWWSSTEPHYEDFYTLWDQFRTQLPLLTVIQPERSRDMVRSLIDTYRHTGWLPDGRVAGINGLTQGGSNGDVVIADAIVKDLSGIDYATAFEALIKDAEQDSPDPYFVGREKIGEYKRLGYLPLEVTRSGSRTMEYAYDDFAVSQVAAKLGKSDLAELYRRRSLSWANLWDSTSKSIRPRKASGEWQTPFDRTEFTSAWTSPFYEGTPWQYSTFVPHDVQGLINRLGGDAAFVEWLDAFFAQGGYWPGNEPDLMAPWLYIFAGRPDRSQSQVRDLLAKHYKLGRDGLPGNDDAGAMTSWFVWSAIGLYPNAGQDYYFVGAPLFTRTHIDVGNKRTFTIAAPGASDVNRYIRGAKLNGHPLDRAWLTHRELTAGGTLELELGPAQSNWGTGQRPYSVEAKPPPK